MMTTGDKAANESGTAEAHATLGRALRDQGKLEEAAASYRRATVLDPRNAVFRNDLGNVLAEQGKLEEAIASYEKALEICPDYPEAHNNLANLYQMTGRLEEATAGYEKAIGLRPDYAEAHRNLGSLLYRQGRLPEAIASLQIAVSLNPEYGEATALLEHQMRHMCEWKGLDALSRSLIQMVEQGSGEVNPFGFLCLESSAAQQLLCATQWAAQNAKYASGDTPCTFRNDGRITVGYLSADFHEHATAHLISELFSLHDRRRFRIVGYSYGPDDGSAARERLRRSFDQFVDIRNESFAESARRIRADGVQILVDLKGYTADARLKIMAFRPAPIQVNYLGYPGTMGSDAIDYAIVDRIVVPPEEQAFFSEKFVHLPDCYQVNDSTRRISKHIPSRKESGLPESGFVFCCFNASYKITPKVFNVWTRLLKAVPESVLWLLDSNPYATANLKREAEDRGVVAERLVFAGHLPYPDHLARFGVADLFLDTFPYNAHTLASDALWGGCPVVTCSGRTLPSRVAGSLLHSVGLQELVCGSLAEYEKLAVALARNSERLLGLREKLRTTRLTARVFDTRRFTRHLEAAFEIMWERYRRGEPLRRFAVSAEG
jgi:predicted O-linked N-acetylglucosamine transferase (SPINDLY family)